MNLKVFSGTVIAQFIVITRHLSRGIEQKHNVLLSEILNDSLPDTSQKS